MPDMGIIGRYLDALPDDATDRIIRAQEWGDTWDGHCRRLLDPVAHAEARAPEERGAVGGPLRWCLRTMLLCELGPFSRRRIRIRFARAVRRAGRERIVRAIKLRAAERHRGFLTGVEAERR